jgi:hypothetical protein
VRSSPVTREGSEFSVDEGHDGIHRQVLSCVKAGYQVGEATTAQVRHPASLLSRCAPLFERRLERLPATVDPAANRPEFDPERGTDLLVGKALYVTEYDSCPEFWGEAVQCLLQIRIEMSHGVDLLRARPTTDEPVGVLR